MVVNVIPRLRPECGLGMKQVVVLNNAQEYMVFSSGRDDVNCIKCWLHPIITDHCEQILA